MGFYYFSIFSVVLLGVVYGLLLLAFWGIARLTRGMPGRKALLATVGAVFLVLPVAEELWIAWNFGQACEGAGTFIYKKVQVEGYYDDTGGGTMTRLVGRPPYKFIESRDSSGKYRRVEYASPEEKAGALMWYAEKNPGRKPGQKEWITHPVSDRVQVTVEMDTGYAWRITKLDRPTARYHYSKPHSHSGVSYKVKMFEYLVRDSQADEVLAREKTFARNAPWYFIGLERPTLFCPVSGKYGERIHATIYDIVLEPAGRP